MITFFSAFFFGFRCLHHVVACPLLSDVTNFRPAGELIAADGVVVLSISGAYAVIGTLQPATSVGALAPNLATSFAQNTPRGVSASFLPSSLARQQKTTLSLEIFGVSSTPSKTPP